MKKLLLFVLIAGLMAPVAGFSQLDKGDLMNPFSVGLSYYHKKYDDYHINDFTFNLSDGLGIFVIDRLAVGPGLTFSLENSRLALNDAGADDYTNQFSYSILFSPFVRYYFAQSGKLAFFAQAAPSIGFEHSKTKNVNPGDPDTYFTNKLLSYGGIVGAGMTFFFNDNIGLETQLQYSLMGGTSKYESGTATDEQHPVTGTVMLNVGLNFYLQP